MDELIGSISAFENVIYSNNKVSAAYGSLLSHLFAKLEANWRGEIFNVDIKTVQFTLLKRILLSQAVHKGNLVIWTAALKEIRMLSTVARELAVKWVLRGCKTEESDWPVIFHNLLLMCQDNRALVFEVLYGCLEERPSAPLMDHLIFLIGQNGSLGKSWIKWTLARGCFKIAPIVFSGLLSLSQDVEYFHVLNSALLNNIKLIHEIWTELSRKQSSQIQIVIDSVEYLKQVAKWIGSDCEAGIKGALQLIENMRKDGLKEQSESFFIELYKLYPFARRELLKFTADSASISFWKALHDIDVITLKEDSHVIEKIIKTPPELLRDLIDHEDQIEVLDISDRERIRALIAIQSIVVKKALKSIDFPCGSETVDISEDWKDMSVGELSVLSMSNSQMIPRLVELCELLQVPGALEGCKAGRDNLTALAIKFVASEASEGVYNARDRIGLISKLISNTSESTGSVSVVPDFTGLLRLPCDWNSYEGTLKYLLENISIFSPEFNLILPKIPIKIDFQILLSRAICRISEHTSVPLTNELLGVIGGMAGRVVSEPQLSKALINLLSIKNMSPSYSCSLNVQKFAEISEPNLIKAVVDFAMEYEGVIAGIEVELIKSIVMFYGIIEGEDVGGVESRHISAPLSKLKHAHLNEKSVNFAVLALLQRIHQSLSHGHKLLKHCPEIYIYDPAECIKKWMFTDELLGMTRGLISGKAAAKLHLALTSFYDLTTKLLQLKPPASSALKELTGIVGGQLNRQVYALIPLQQEKMQNNLKQDLNLKKADEKRPLNAAGNAGKTVTGLVFAMEKFEETLIKAVESGEEGWCEKIVRSTARDFKIRLEQL